MSPDSLPGRIPSIVDKDVGYVGGAVKTKLSRGTLASLVQSRGCFGPCNRAWDLIDHVDKVTDIEVQVRSGHVGSEADRAGNVFRYELVEGILSLEGSLHHAIADVTRGTLN